MSWPHSAPGVATDGRWQLPRLAPSHRQRCRATRGDVEPHWPRGRCSNTRPRAGSERTVPGTRPRGDRQSRRDTCRMRCALRRLREPGFRGPEDSSGPLERNHRRQLRGIRIIQCPFCGAFARDFLPRLEEKYVRTNEVQIAFSNFPLPNHASAMNRCGGRRVRGTEQQLLGLPRLDVSQSEQARPGQFGRRGPSHRNQRH